MQKDQRAKLSTVTSQIKLKVTPENAAVIFDSTFAGHVHEFGGVGRAMLVSPGKHHLKMTSPDTRSLTQMGPAPQSENYNKTDLVPGSITQADPSMKKQDPPFPQPGKTGRRK